MASSSTFYLLIIIITLIIICTLTLYQYSVLLSIDVEAEVEIEQEKLPYILLCQLTNCTCQNWSITPDRIYSHTKIFCKDLPKGCMPVKDFLHSNDKLQKSQNLEFLNLVKSNCISRHASVIKFMTANFYQNERMYSKF